GVRRPAGALALRLRGLANQKIRLGRRKTSSRAGYLCAHQLLSDSNKNLITCQTKISTIYHGLMETLLGFIQKYLEIRFLLTN
ncbi:MAG: hypothetical protein PUD64_05640, partial [Bacteroidales bacterium]|nr:hypothetical protein [Bacteroidales bacterium]